MYSRISSRFSSSKLIFKWDFFAKLISSINLIFHDSSAGKVETLAFLMMCLSVTRAEKQGLLYLERRKWRFSPVTELRFEEQDPNNSLMWGFLEFPRFWRKPMYLPCRTDSKWGTGERDSKKRVWVGWGRSQIILTAVFQDLNNCSEESEPSLQSMLPYASEQRTCTAFRIWSAFAKLSCSLSCTVLSINLAL